MQKQKSSHFQMMFLLGFLFMIIAAFGTFVLGLQIGINKTEARYAYLKDMNTETETSTSYAQQDLVTFYYVVFQPYQQFKENFFNLTDDLQRSQTTSHSNDALKDIRSLAKQQYQQISAHSIAASSPLLKEAQSDFLKSLKLFEEGADKALSSSGSKTGSEFAKFLAQDEFMKNAKSYSLQAQKKYYASILKWTAKGNPSIPVNFSYQSDLTINQWTSYPIAVKNKAVTDMMAGRKIFVSYLPQDLTAKIDNMIRSGKAKELNLHSVSSIVKVLTDTEAVKAKEFSRWKSTYYASEKLPELPFFTEE